MSQYPSKPKPKYTKLGVLLRTKRIKDDIKVNDIAARLKVSSNYVYMVEQGWRKPKDGYLNTWAGAYGIEYLDLCKSVGKIPLDFVKTFKNEYEKPDQLASLTELEKSRLLPFLEYIKWKLYQQTFSDIKVSSSKPASKR
jgi:transcriptional regulator with XRE-family HTH domain